MSVLDPPFEDDDEGHGNDDDDEEHGLNLECSYAIVQSMSQFYLFLYHSSFVVGSFSLNAPAYTLLQSCLSVAKCKGEGANSGM